MKDLHLIKYTFTQQSLPEIQDMMRFYDAHPDYKKEIEYDTLAVIYYKKEPEISEVKF